MELCTFNNANSTAQLIGHPDYNDELKRTFRMPWY